VAAVADEYRNVIFAPYDWAAPAGKQIEREGRNAVPHGRLLGTVFAEASKRLVPKPGRLERPVLKSISCSHWNARYGADSGPPRRL
jgi:hypothetical protein